MAKALSVDRVVKVSINLQPLAAGRRNFGVLLIAGTSDVIDMDERIRAYTDIDAVAADFGLYAQEYKAAELFFSQSPRPAQLRIGRWAKSATPAVLKGAVLPEDAAGMEGWNSISDGSFCVTIGGEKKEIKELDFSQQTNLNGVAEVINTSLAAAGASCVWTGERFVFSTTAKGSSATIGYAAALDEPSGTDISYRLRMTESTGLTPVNGVDGETLKEAVAALADKSGEWYGLMVADDSLTVEEHLEAAAFIQSSAKSRIYGATITDTRVLEAAWKDDLAEKARELNYTRTVLTYSQNPYAIASALGRAFTVDFNANRSTITLKFKQMPGIAAEGLSETQAGTLAAKRCNVFAAYDNDTAIFQEGVMSGQAWFDEIHGLDWLQNAVQTEVWNLLYQSKTKIPQTESGANQVMTCIEACLEEAVNNGLVAPGVWNADGFGLLERGDYLEKGYYVYASPIADQAQSEREQRKLPPVQVAVKLAGAVHSVDVQIDVNR